MTARDEALPAVFNHAQGQYLNVGDARLYYEIAGRVDGTPLLCLHGGLGDMRDLNPVLPALAPQHRLIGLDFRGHGRSTLGSQALTYALYQSDVQALLRHLRIESALALGFSDGGITGYRLACETGGAFSLPRLATIGAQWRIDEGSPALPMLQGLTSARWQAMFPDALPYYQNHNPQPDFDRLVQAVKALWTDTDPSRGYPGETVRRMTQPVLVIRGDRDDLLDLSEATELRERLSEGALLNLPFAGHAAHADAPDMVAPLLGRFFSCAQAANPLGAP